MPSDDPRCAFCETPLAAHPEPLCSPGVVRELRAELERLRAERDATLASNTAAIVALDAHAAEVERLRAEHAHARQAVEAYARSEQLLAGRLRAAQAERDTLKTAITDLANEWQATIDRGVMAGSEWEQCLRANLPHLRAALTPASAPERRRELLADLTAEALDAGSYGEPAPQMRPNAPESHADGPNTPPSADHTDQPENTRP